MKILPVTLFRELVAAFMTAYMTLKTGFGSRLRPENNSVSLIVHERLRVIYILRPMRGGHCSKSTKEREAKSKRNYDATFGTILELVSVS